MGKGVVETLAEYGSQHVVSPQVGEGLRLFLVSLQTINKSSFLESFRLRKGLLNEII